jgi:signal transduction histidine kinase
MLIGKHVRNRKVFGRTRLGVHRNGDGFPTQGRLGMNRLPFGLHRIWQLLARGMHQLCWHVHHRRLPPDLRAFARHEMNPLSLRLHDEVGQWLALGLLHLDDIRANRPDLHESLTSLRTSVERAMQSVRDITHAKNTPPRLANSLHAAIVHTLNNGPWASHALQQSLSDELAAISMKAAPLAVRTIHELVGNAHRHAYASDVRLRVWSNNDKLHIQVEDDGIGMANPDDHRHFGLRSLRYQVAREGGRFHLCARPGMGTRVTVDLPLRGHQS